MLSSKLQIPHGIKNNYLVQNNEYGCICKSQNTIIVCDSSSRESPLSLCTECEWGFLFLMKSVNKVVVVGSMMYINYKFFFFFLYEL